jgi:cytochrome c-type biogenesis protein
VLAAALPFGYAFGAGMVASVNPCGFLMLPAFGSYYLGFESGRAASSAWVRAGQALLLGTIASLGFVVLFGGVGAVLALGGRGIIRFFPWGGLLVGLGLLGLGLWLLVSKRPFGVMAASRVEAPFAPGVRNVFLFGVAYGICSLACTLPIFLVVVGTALVTGGFLQSVGQFVSYGLGMGTILVLVTLSTALFSDALSTRLRRLLPHVHTLAAAFMALAGAWIIYYWLALGRLLG